jgi:hypothetical protein
MVDEYVSADGMLGLTEASTPRRFARPCTVSRSLTTLDLSLAGAIPQVSIRCGC